MSARPTGPTPTRARLSLVLLLYFLGVIAVITLAPFRFIRPREIRLLASGDWFDVVANVLLFVPLGFLYPLTRATDDEPSLLEAAILGALLSVSIETIQIFEPARVSSLLDVLANTAGALAGALLVRASARRIRVNAKLVGRLSLEIPLIGLIYLLVPLLVVASLSAEQQPLRMLAVLPLGLVGARLIGAVQRNHFGPSGLFDARGAASVGAGWMAMGTFPVWLRYPVAGIAMVGAVAAMAWFECSHAALPPHADRRFESETLRRAAPFIVAYLLVATFLPLGDGIRHWRFEIGLTGARRDLGMQMVRLLEPVAAMTVLGYLLAEARGRRELPFPRVVRRVAAECACIALAMETSRGFQRGVGASGAQLALVIAAGILGAAIYHHQREHVRWILAHRRETAKAA